MAMFGKGFFKRGGNIEVATGRSVTKDPSGKVKSYRENYKNVKERDGLGSRLVDGALSAPGQFLLNWEGPGAIARRLAEEFLPKSMNKVTVMVTGSPRSNLNDLYFLAMSTAFGTLKQFTYIADSQIDCAIDRDSKTVAVVLTYTTNAIAQAANFLGGLSIQSGKEMIQSGVPDDVKGADWPLFLKLVKNNKELPLIDQTIVTQKPDKNYVPYEDGLSRDNDLVAVISAALLQGPCASPGLPYTSNQGTNPQKATSPFGPQIKSVPSLGSTKPTSGGVDTSRWSSLAAAGAAGGIPNWINPPDYQTDAASELRTN